MEKENNSKKMKTYKKSNKLLPENQQKKSVTAIIAIVMCLLIAASYVFVVRIYPMLSTKPIEFVQTVEPSETIEYVMEGTKFTFSSARPVYADIYESGNETLIYVRQFNEEQRMDYSMATLRVTSESIEGVESLGVVGASNVYILHWDERLSIDIGEV